MRRARTASGSRCRTERRRFTGFQDLQERDVFRLFRQGQVDVVQFHAPENEYCHLIEPTEAFRSVPG